MHLVRYAMVGGIGIPVSEIALWFFYHLLFKDNHGFFFVAQLCSFEISTTVNFLLNQYFTYREQAQHVKGWGLVKRAVRAQVTSFSANLVSLLTGDILVYLFNVNPYIATLAGIILAFGYNYFISRRFVYRDIKTEEVAEIVTTTPLN
ncbi:GtrA family protein [Dictyobacter arantiisoli]|nr:GtrA family protein [Dictyobacter arantiisoli]